MRTQNIHFQDKIRDLELIPNKSISAVMEKKTFLGTQEQVQQLRKKTFLGTQEQVQQLWKKNISRDSRTSSAVMEKNISRDSRTISKKPR